MTTTDATLNSYDVLDAALKRARVRKVMEDLGYEVPEKFKETTTRTGELDTQPESVRIKIDERKRVKVLTIKNAKIIDYFLGIAHDELTMTVFAKVSDEGYTQGFGGRRINGEYAALWIREVLEVVGVDSIKKIVGQPIRVAYENDGYDIVGIGNFLEDRWFYPDED
jgi:hypothetical protein